MSHSHAKELLKEGLDPAKFGFHSLHTRGSSIAAALAVLDTLFQRCGGWCSEQHGTFMSRSH